MHNRQAHPGTLTERFCREHWIENLRNDLWRDATTQVADLQGDTVVCRSQTKGNQPTTLGAVGINAVGNQVRHYLCKPPRGTVEFDALCCRFKDRFAALFAQLVTQQQQCLSNDRHGVKAMSLLRRQIARLPLDAAHKTGNPLGRAVRQANGLLHLLRDLALVIGRDFRIANRILILFDQIA